jgi:hypothetical protein
MRGANGRYGALGTGLAAAVLALAACSASPLESTKVPTFPTSADATGLADVRPNDGAIPNDCAQILSVADLEALLGMPLGSVDVRTTLGVPQPLAGRTERVACQYTSSAGGRSRGSALLDVNASAFTDADAAAKQWRINADAEDGGRRELPIGSASAVLLERPGEAVLMVVNGASNVTVVLPDQPLPGGRPPADVLVDLALRVLPAVTATPPPAPTPATAGVAETRGAAS